MLNSTVYSESLCNHHCPPPHRSPHQCSKHQICMWTNTPHYSWYTQHPGWAPKCKLGITPLLTFPSLARVLTSTSKTNHQFSQGSMKPHQEIKHPKVNHKNRENNFDDQTFLWALVSCVGSQEWSDSPAVLPNPMPHAPDCGQGDWETAGVRSPWIPDK